VAAGERPAGTVLAQGRVGDGFAPPRDVDLRPGVEAFPNAGFDRRPRAGQPLDGAVDG
jgi:hypothetical protein